MNSKFTEMNPFNINCIHLFAFSELLKNSYPFNGSWNKNGWKDADAFHDYRLEGFKLEKLHLVSDRLKEEDFIAIRKKLDGGEIAEKDTKPKSSIANMETKVRNL